MEDIKKYYENTENALPNPTVRTIIEMNIKPENAIDLGCGAGRDTVYLIKNGWKVLAGELLCIIEFLLLAALALEKVHYAIFYLKN